MSEPLKITIHDPGDVVYFQRMVFVGGWCSGGDRTDAVERDKINREAVIISHALAPADTVERQMALAVLQGDDAAALALADALCLARRDEADAGLYAAAPEMLAALLELFALSVAPGNYSEPQRQAMLTAAREAIRKARGE